MDNTEQQNHWLQRDFLVGLLKQLPLQVFWKNKDSVYLGCNDAFANSLGFSSPNDIIGKTDYDLPTKKEESEAYQADDRDVMTSLKPKLNIEEYQTLPDGRKIVLLTNKVPILNKAGEVIGVLGIYSDITDRKKMEQKLSEAKERAESSDRAKTDFLYNMRHDLRTPFSGILGCSDLMESQETDPIKKENLSCIAQSAKALLDQLNEIFEFVQVESGHLPVLEKTFDLHQLLHDVMSMMRLAAKNKNLDFDLTLEKEVPQYVVGDKVRTQRILMNLIANAIKFTETGHIKVLVHVADQSENKFILNFIVEDTGIGIHEDKRDIIFERFNRLTASYSGAYPGNGLGLRMVKQFLDEIDGQSDLDTTLGKGSTFTITIPYKIPLLNPLKSKAFSNKECVNLKEPLAQAEIPPSLEAKKSNTCSSPQAAVNTLHKILLVEDHAIAAKMARAILLSVGCQVDIGKNGETALDLVEKNDYDLIFMDIGLPDIDGCEITRRIRLNKRLDKAQIPIVALTAHSDSQIEKRCLDIGINKVIIKPLVKQHAEEILNKFLHPAKKEETYALPDQNKTKMETSSESAVDFDYAKNLLGGNEKILNEILMILGETLPDEVNALEEAYAQQNWEAIQSIAHKLKGGSSYCGTIRLKSACTQLDEYIRSYTAKKLDQFSQKPEAERLYYSVLSEIVAVQKFLADRNITESDI